MTRAIDIEGRGVRVNGRSVGVGSAIPDSVVSRTPDDNIFNGSEKYGLQIETTVVWPEIGAEISSNTSGATRAYVYRVSDGQLMGDTDITGLTGGDTFFIDLSTNLVSGETYNFVLDAEGASYDGGYNDLPSFPYTSSDGDLSIVAGADGETGAGSDAWRFVRVGNV